MDKVADFKHELCEQYPILSKTGSVSLSCDPSEILRQNAGKHVLILMVSVQGAGKTTFCSKHFSSGCTVVNPDEILQRCLESDPDMSFDEIHEMIYNIEMRKIRKGLKKGIVVLDASCIDIYFRTHILESFEELYDKAIIIALNPKRKTIQKQIEGQMSIRMRPELWEEVEKEMQSMDLQLTHHIFEMGVDEMYVV